MIVRGGVYWVDLGEPRGSRPAKRRPIIVIQSEAYNASQLGTVMAAVVTSNTSLASMPGNVFLPAGTSGLPRDSVVNVTAVITLDKNDLAELVDTIPGYLMDEVDRGLRGVLNL